MTSIETDELKKLKAKRAAIDARIRQKQQKLNKTERDKDTRRKVLVGAAMLSKAARDSETDALVERELAHFLTRPDDRALFGLPPLAPPTEESAKERKLA